MKTIRGFVRICVMALCLFVLLSCCNRQRPVVEEITSTRPNIILISLDACRADHLSCYGYDRKTSPFLDSLAAEGRLFKQAFVNTHGTPPSHTTILTSLYQESHGMSLAGDMRSGKTQEVSPSTLMVQEILRGSGYLTLAVTGGGHMGSALAFDRGFVDFDGRPGHIRQQKHRLLRMLDRVASIDMPLFILLHTYEIHSPYMAPQNFNDLFDAGESDFEPTTGNLLKFVHNAGKLRPQDIERVKALYDAEIRFTDGVLKETFKALEKRGLLDNALVIITADHGEEFGEHGGFLHRGNLYDELLRVPMILWQNGGGAGRVEERPVSSVDIGPTILRAAGIDVPGNMAGRDLLAVEDWPVEDEPAVFSQYGQDRYAVRTRNWKLIVNRKPPLYELYDLVNDPGEIDNVAVREVDVVERLEKRLDEWLQSLPQLGDRPKEVVVSQEEVKYLEALGYVDPD